MELALYGPSGFYTGAASGSAGRRGDFITSPEIGPLFGAVLARLARRGVAAPRHAGRLRGRRRGRRAGHLGAGDRVGRTGVPPQPALRRRGAVRCAAAAPSRHGRFGRHRIARDPARRAVHRGGDRQRAARQPAVPAGGVRRRLARGVRRPRHRRAVRRGAVGATRSAPCDVAALGPGRCPGAAGRARGGVRHDQSPARRHGPRVRLRRGAHGGARSTQVARVAAHLPPQLAAATTT